MKCAVLSDTLSKQAIIPVRSARFDFILTLAMSGAEDAFMEVTAYSTFRWKYYQ